MHLDSPLVRFECLSDGDNVSVGVVYSLDDGRVLQPLVIPVLVAYTQNIINSAIERNSNKCEGDQCFRIWIRIQSGQWIWIQAGHTKS